MNLTRRAAAAATLALLACTGAQAEDFPVRGRTITIVNPYPPGGLGDILARAVAQKMAQSLGTPVIVENKPGANGSIGISFVARAKPDGYTIAGVPMSTLAINPVIYKSLPYQPAKDLTPLGVAISYANVLIANNEVPVQSLAELPAYVKANAQKLNFASQGNGSSGHLEGELLNLTMGTRITHVPYQGSGPALQDLLSGKVQFLFETVPAALPFIRAGKVKAFGVASDKPPPQLAEVPSISSVVKDFQATNWIGFVGPAGLSPEVLAKLNEHLRNALQSADVRKLMDERAATVVGGSPDDMRRLIEADTQKWTRVVREAGVTVN